MDLFQERLNYQNERKGFKKIYNKLKTDESYRDNTEFEEFEVLDGLNISTIRIKSAKEQSNLLVITTGLHGMEGFWGSFILRKYADWLLEKINTDKTGIIFVHGINPWGMENLRRTNENNVDLNRSFIGDINLENHNKSYIKNSWFFKPQKLTGSSLVNNLMFFYRLLKVILLNGTSALEGMTLLGQYAVEKGVYFGGKEKQVSTEYMKKFFDSIIGSNYKNIILIDLHTGFGSRYQMSIVNSKQEETNPQEFSKLIDYPLVCSVSNNDFYNTEGDIVEYFYSSNKANGNSKQLYSTCFEFGTLGNSLFDKISSLRIMLQENSLFYSGKQGDKLFKHIKNEFIEMYYPSEPKWRDKAEADFRRAMDGIIKHYKL